MRGRRRASAGLTALLLATALGGCTGVDPGGDPSPSLTSAPSPSSSSAQPSSSASTSERPAARKERLAYEEAERNYRAFAAEYDRLAQAGGTTKATKVMKANAAGPYLEVKTAFLKNQKGRDERTVGELRIAYVRRSGYNPSQLLLDVCEDGNSIRVVDAEGNQVSEGQSVRLTLQLRPVDGRWKIWDGNDDVVNQCGE